MTNENKEIFSFKNRNEEDIIGILHKPDNCKKKDVIAILLNPGLKSRVGPHRLYVKIAERLVSLGLSVFRYDSHGIGESGGEFVGNLKEVLHDQVLSGVLVPDVLDTVNFLEKKIGLKKVILIGLCGGAMTALQAASYLKNIEAIVMLGLPVTFVGKKEEDFVKNINQNFAGFILTLYLKKIINFKSWKRLLTFQSEYKLIFKIIWLKVKKIFVSQKESFIPNNPKINTIMLDRYPELCIKCPRQLFVFAETEGNRYEFEDQVKEHFLSISEQNSSKMDIAIIPNSNHEYSILESQEDLLQSITNWLRKEIVE